MKTTPLNTTRQQGFTLIELSIVLVIIGLIVGGVLVGQDLIKAATIRATTSQMEKYNTAVNTFNNKYNGVPGDMVSGANFFAAVANQTTTGITGLGNGNGLIEPGTVGFLDGESSVFWAELASANLISDPILPKYLDYTANKGDAISSANLPVPKLAKGNYIGVTSAAGLNYFVMGKLTLNLNTALMTAGLTPLEASQIDAKTDDGVPSTGTIISLPNTVAALTAPQTAGNGLATASVVATTCYDSTLNAYAVAAQPNSVSCSISLRANF